MITCIVCQKTDVIISPMNLLQIKSSVMTSVSCHHGENLGSGPEISVSFTTIAGVGYWHGKGIALSPGDLEPKRSFLDIRDYVDQWGEQTSKEQFQVTSAVLICSHGCRVRKACRTRGEERPQRTDKSKLI